MRQSVHEHLLDLNRQFYTIVGDEFDRTRQSLPAGMVALAQRVATSLPASGRVLDAGCGNGRFARALAEAGVQAAYTGLDGDARLLALAAEQTAGLASLSCRFAQVDLARSGWTAAAGDAPYDVVVCLAVLHHFPGYVLRRRVLAEMAGLLAPGGLLALSTWQFLSVSRFVDRGVTWESVGLNEADVEPGDALLTWNQGAQAVRYVHNLDLAEVTQLAADCDLAVVETFRADGKEGNLNLFAIMRPGAGASGAIGQSPS